VDGVTGEMEEFLERSRAPGEMGFLGGSWTETRVPRKDFSSISRAKPGISASNKI